jgi:hypothetical protein
VVFIRPRLDAIRLEGVAAARTAERKPEPLGAMARRVFAAQRRSSKRQVHSRFKKNFWVRFALARMLWRVFKYGIRNAPVVREKRGISYRRQFALLLRLALVHRVDPIAYYSHRLYDHPDGIREAENYLGRLEMKNGIYSLLRCLRAGDPNSSAPLSDKVGFERHCRAHGVPTPPILATVDPMGRWLFADDPRTLACDLFAKTLDGRGAVGAHGYRYRGGDTYATDGNRSLSRQGMLEAVARRGAGRDMILMPRLVNHPEIADLADRSLITFRVFTCFDSSENPIVTHAMLRTVSKLEVDWETEEEFAAAIDLDTGCLSLMCGDANLSPDAWWRTHPKTGARVFGRRIAAWPDLAAIAIRAHRAFSGRMIVGWDLAWTPDGPIVIEGNSDPDTHFLQRVHRQMIGHSPLAPLLRHHLPRAQALLHD